jgi:hypothetical protein
MVKGLPQMSMEYIRNYYGVPAHLGGRVRYAGDPAGAIEGLITGTNGPHLLVQFDDAKHPSVLHPTWRIEYLGEAE